MKSPVNIPPVYLLTGVIIIIITFFFLPQFNIIRFPFNLTGLPIVLIGLYLAGQAYELFSKYKTTLTFSESNTLVVDGIFNYSRNPMYLGMVSLLAGLSILFGNWIGLATPVLFFILIDRIFIPFEENKMRLKFGKAYEEYCRKVRRWL
jgi:protein-S-isoprenylcysteine O-methyltransferase Ste14